MEIFRSEIKAGLVIIVSAILLGIAIFVVGDLKSLWEDKKTFVLLFRNADGISKGAPVWYAGLEVGEVSNLRILHGMEDRIALTVLISSDARVRKDSRAYIRNLGMMGSKYVEITPGSHGSPELSYGDVLEGETPASIAQLIETGQQIAVSLQETVQGVQGLVQELSGDGSIQQTLQNANAFLIELRQHGEDIKRLFGQAEDLLGTSRGSITVVADAIRETSQTLNQAASEGGEELTALLSELRETNQGLQRDLDQLEQKIDPVINQAHTDLREAGGLLRDARLMLDTNDQNLYSLILHLKEVSRHLDVLSEDLRAHPWKIVWKAKGSSDGGSPTGPEGPPRTGRSGLKIAE
jgi:phospholipid/cholesterol/gamma-HCH transport system substrate-binding protein